ncbi:oxidoreductase [Capsulimonas corticalis]|uniref:Oxidoreductase n=1 Tax=Capsulimonas corticalis TaxID=2219043 RepID=A0A9N7LBE3_9BACT|nr:SDR family NAD(P)-dependent oxidoreductase [Capsulimonas corticalis]BDI32880.1 oxidoreductase [Capsulimonas corticalis]
MARMTQEPAMEGKVVIVTGASSGVGYATVRRLIHSEGATVIAVARRRMFRIEALANQAAKGQLTAITADMADRGQADALMAQVFEKYGHVDAFVHAVNRVLKLSALDVTDQEFDLTMQVNVKSALYAVQALTPHLRRQRCGGIVIYNPTPLETEAFVASEAVYAASANALSALASGWRRQLSSFGIPVVEVAPCPAKEALLATQTPHDQQIVETLRDTMFMTPRAGLTAIPEPLPPHANFSAPTVISERGGLRLMTF